MELKLTINFIYPSGNINSQKELESFMGTLSKSLSVRMSPDHHFECQLDEFVVICSELVGKLKLDHDSYGVINNSELFIYDKIDGNRNIYPCSSLEFAALKYFELRRYQAELDKLTSLLNHEVSRLQNFYRHKVPHYVQNISGLKISTKFKTGSYPGGDFFDIIETASSILIVLISVDSHLFNAEVIEKVLEYKQQVTNSGVSGANILELVNSMIDLQQTYQPSRVQLLVLEVNKASRCITGYQFGGADFFFIDQGSLACRNDFSLDSGNVEKAYFEGVLDSSLVISSSGMIENWLELSSLKTFHDHLRSCQNSIDGIESSIIRLYEQNCIKYDITMIWIEVNKYGIRKV